MSFSVFADGSDDYIVPDSPYVTGLQIKDNDTGEFIVKRSMRAPARSSDSSESVYYFKDLVTIYYDWCTPNFNVLPNVIGLYTVNGYRGYQFKESTEEFYKKYNSFKTGQKQLPLLRASNKYHITFTMRQTNAWGAYRFYLYDSVDSSRVIYLAKKDYSQSIGVNASFDFYVTIPESWTGVPTLAFESTQLQYSSGLYSIFINDLTFSDVTNENLDKSLSKFGDRIKGFFIPKEGFFDDVKSRFDKLLSEHLGFLYEAPSMVGSIFGVVKDWNPPEQPTITLPAFNFDIGNDHIHLWDEQVYTFDFLANQPWSTLYAFYKTFIFVLLSVAMINLAIKKYHSIVGGGDADDN